MTAPLQTVLLGLSLLCLPTVQPARSERIYQPGDGVVLPKVIKQASPFQAGPLPDEQGSVLLRCVVSADGVPTGIEIIKSSGERFDARAKESLTRWRFEPGLKDGIPVPVEVTVKIAFSGSESSKERKRWWQFWRWW